MLNKYFSQQIYSLIILCFFFIVPIMMFYYNFPKTDLHVTHIGNNQASDILSQLSSNSILFLNKDNVTFNTWYVHYVLGVRKDIKLINNPGSGGDVSEEKIVTDYIKKNPNKSFDEIANGIIANLSKTHDVFSTYALNLNSTDFVEIPYGLSFKITKKDQIPTGADYKEKTNNIISLLHIPRRETLSLAEQNSITPDITHFYSDAFRHMGEFTAIQYSDLPFAIELYKKAVWIDNQNSTAYANLAYFQSKSNLCEDAKNNMKKAIEIYSIYKPYYFELYTIYNKCNPGTKITAAIKQNYISIFKEDPEKEKVDIVGLLDL